MAIIPFWRRRLFISHASANHEWVDRLCPALKRHGLVSFVDHDPREGIQPGDEWQRALSKDLKKAQSVLLLITPEWRESSWCQAEYKTALLLGKHLIPVVLGETPHVDIEPQRQKVFIGLDRSEVDPDVAEAIAKAVPLRIGPPLIAALVPVLVLGAAALGAETGRMGPWDLVEFTGGAFAGLAKSPSEPGLVYAASSESFGRPGVYESRDSGKNWEALQVPQLKGNVNGVSTGQDEVFVASDGAALFLDRKDSAWRTLELSGLSSEFLFIEPVPGRPHELVWGTLRLGGVSISSAISIQTTSSDGLHASTLSGVPGGLGSRKENGEATYAPFQVNDVAFHPQKPKIAAFAAPNEDTVILTTNGLETYRTLDSFPGKRPLRVLIDGDSDGLFVAGADGLWRAFFDDWDTGVPVFEHMHEGSFATACLAKGRDRLYYGNNQGLFSAPDGREKFEPSPLDLPVNHLNDVAETDDGDLLLATGGGGLFLATPGNNRFRQVATAGPMEVSYGKSFSDFSIVGSGVLLFLSVDGGASYSVLRSLPGNLLCLAGIESAVPTDGETSYRLRSRESRGRAAYEASTLLAGIGQNGVYRKRGGSNDWEPVPEIGTGVASTIVSSPSSPRHLAAVVDGKLFLSRDQGEMWKPHEFDGESSQIHGAFADPKTGFWISTLQGDRLRVRRCGLEGEDLGFFEIDLPGEGITAFAALPDGEWLFGGTNGLVFSVAAAEAGFAVEKRGGIPVERTSWMEFHRSRDGTIHASVLEGAGFRSRDGGRSWNPVEFNYRLSLQKSRIHGIGSDPEGSPEFFTDLGLVRKSRSPSLHFGPYSLTWRFRNVWRRLGIESAQVDGILHR